MQNNDEKTTLKTFLKQEGCKIRFPFAKDKRDKKAPCGHLECQQHGDLLYTISDLVRSKDSRAVASVLAELAILACAEHISYFDPEEKCSVSQIKELSVAVFGRAGRNVEDFYFEPLKSVDLLEAILTDLKTSKGDSF